MRPGRPDQPDGAEELESEAVNPIGLGEFEEITALGGSGAADNDVDCTAGFERGLHQGGRSLRGAKISGKGSRRASIGRNFSRGPA